MSVSGSQAGVGGGSYTPAATYGGGVGYGAGYSAGCGVRSGVGCDVGCGVGSIAGYGAGYDVGYGVGCGVGYDVGYGVGYGVRGALGAASGTAHGVGYGVGNGVGYGVGYDIGYGVGYGVGCSVGHGVGNGIGYGVGHGAGACLLLGETDASGQGFPDPLSEGPVHHIRTRLPEQRGAAHRTISFESIQTRSHETHCLGRSALGLDNDGLGAVSDTSNAAKFCDIFRRYDRPFSPGVRRLRPRQRPKQLPRPRAAESH